MKDEALIEETYQTLYRGMIAKDRNALEKVLDPSFVLVHMTGMRQSREGFISSIENGTLNYYHSETPAKVTVTLRGDRAQLVGKSRVNAAVFGGGRHNWPLRLDIELVREGAVWRMTKAVTSMF